MAKKIFFCLFLVTLLVQYSQQDGNDCEFGESYWSTDYEVPHTFNCPDPQQGMSFFESCHSNHYEDRIWNYRCSDIGVTLNLFEVTDTTDFDATWTVTCPTNQVITGLWCEDSNAANDRRWYFTCGGRVEEDICLKNCVNSGWVNDYDAYFAWAAPDNFVVTGVHSTHDNGHEDRLFDYTYCEMSMCGDFMTTTTTTTTTTPATTTTTTTTTTAPPLNPISLVIPVFVYPSDNGDIAQAYLTLKDSATTYPDITHIIVLNPNNGNDATSEPNSDWEEVIDLFSGVANVKLIGYVWTNYGETDDEGDVRDKIQGYHDNGWNVEGIYFSGCDDHSDSDEVYDMYANYMELTRSLWDSKYSVFDFGYTPPEERWYTTSDINVLLDGKGMDDLDDFDPSNHQEALPKSVSSLQLRDVDPDDIDIDAAWSSHFGSVYFTDRENDYNDIYSPDDWDKMMQKIDQFAARATTGHNKI